MHILYEIILIDESVNSNTLSSVAMSYKSQFLVTVKVCVHLICVLS